MKAIALRETALLSADGFVGLVVNEDKESLVFAVSTMWQVSERGCVTVLITAVCSNRNLPFSQAETTRVGNFKRPGQTGFV